MYSIVYMCVRACTHTHTHRYTYTINIYNVRCRFSVLVINIRTQPILIAFHLHQNSDNSQSHLLEYKRTCIELNYNITNENYLSFGVNEKQLLTHITSEIINLCCYAINSFVTKISK